MLQDQVITYTTADDKKNKNAKALRPHLVIYCFDFNRYLTGSYVPNALNMHIFVISGSKTICLDILFSFLATSGFGGHFV